MARNRFFNQYTPVRQEQNLVEDLIIEAIKIYGVQAYYLPRTHVNLDTLYAEDASMLFDDAIELELYIKTFDGFLGQEDFLSKFGLQIDESINFVVAQKRFLQSLKVGLLTEYSYNLLLEDGNELINEVTYDYDAIIRPREGDLIWFPMAKYMYEIKFTENIENFFQLGKLYTFELRCERYRYSNERIDTDIEEIDNIEEIYSQSTEFISKALLEDDTLLLLQDGSYLIEEGVHIQEKDNTAENDYIASKINEKDILDFTEYNPFAAVREF
jgi:hypothetical protein